MARTRININKTENGIETEPTSKDVIQEMTEKINTICQLLLTDSNEFDRVTACDEIIDYLDGSKRILYAPISNTIYACYNEHEAEETEKMMGDMTANMQAVVEYTLSDEYKRRRRDAGKKQKAFDDTKKAVLKIWDHINLAQMQYSTLKQTDSEYEEKFNKMVTPIKEDLSKDLNAQLLTMVGIFTALAFLIFGGISSLGNIFSNQEVPVLKLMIIGSVWGVCMLNLVFVFLFCVGKMTKLKFTSTDDPDASIFKKYPIVWWTNLVIISIMILSLWAYYLTKKNLHTWFDQVCYKYPKLATIAGTALIVFMIAFLIQKLYKATKHTNGNDQ